MKLTPSMLSTLEIFVMDVAHDGDEEIETIRACINGKTFTVPTDRDLANALHSVMVDMANDLDDIAEDKSQDVVERRMARKDRDVFGKLSSACLQAAYAA